jgi:hypothetical protein
MKTDRKSSPVFSPRADEIECMLAFHFGYRTNVIVPNISWGMGLRECDLLVLTPAGYFYEVEIKVSRADLRADFKKRHRHNWGARRFYFCVPERMADCQELIAAEYPRAGLLLACGRWSSTGNKWWRSIKIQKPAVINSAAQKFGDYERQRVLHLGCMRIWTLKAHLQKARASKVRQQEAPK